MQAFALALVLGLGPTDVDVDRLPTSIAESFVEPARAKADLEWWAGGHLGVAGAYDGDSAVFIIGGQGRVHILPWLGAEVSIDFTTTEDFKGGDIRAFTVPFELAGLFYLPLDGPIHPYASAGLGFIIASTDFHGPLSGRSDDTSVEPLFFIGLGCEYDLSPTIMLDAGLRFVFLSTPGGYQGRSLDFVQFTVGINFKIGK